MATSSNRRRRGGRGRRAAQQKCLTNDTSVIEKALRSLCQNGGQCSLDDLAKIVGKFDPGLGSLEDIISDYQDVHFNIIDNADSSVTVEAYTAAQICPSYLRTDCTEGDGCENLHMCSYFATGSCCWFGQNCRKSHHFRSDHNKRILNLLNIAFLSHQQLKALFRLAWPQFTVPDFCGPYRSKQGCHKQFCRFLHLCKNYVMGKCTYGTRCKFAHDVYIEASNMRLLERFKISLDYSSDDLIRLIKERHEGLYRPEVEVLENYGEESYGEDSDGDRSDGDPSCSKDFYEAGVVGTHDMLENVLLAVSSTENRPDAAATSPSETKCILAKKIEEHPANLLLSRKQEPKTAKQTTSVSGGLGWMAQQGAKSQTPSKQFLDSNIPKTRAVQEKKCILTKNKEEPPANLLPSRKQEPKLAKQTPSVSGGLGGMAQQGAKSQTPSKQFLDSNVPKMRAVQEKECISANKMEEHLANLLLYRKEEPKPAKQTPSVSGGLGGMAQQGAKSQTPSKQFLDSNVPKMRAVQEKECILANKMEEHLANLWLSMKQEPKPAKQTSSVSEGLGGIAQQGAKSQTPSKQFLDSNIPKTRAVQEKKCILTKKIEEHPANLLLYRKEEPKPAKRFLGSNIPRTRAMQEKMEEICKDNLQGMCTSGQLCQRHHCDLPYQWQVQNNGRWESVDSYRNNAMEKKFCDVNNVATCLDFDTWGSMELYYDAMLISNTDNLWFINIRRLEVKGEPHISDAYLISPWLWYWKDECGTWIEYAEQNTKQNASADKESSDFESLYDAYENKNGESTVKFMAGNQQYTLDFVNMTQANDHYRTRKDVRRRPSKYITSGDVKRYREEKPWLSNSNYPRTWDMSIRTKSHRLVKVSKLEDSVEYKKIKGLFETTLPGGKITELERVQNELCWDAFSRQKEAMMKKNLFRLVDERLLFHGTTQEKVEDICRDNFDFRLSGTRVGAVYGQGAYFASTAKYSNDYAQADSNNLKRMFVARVLVGSYTVGNQDMRRPPFKNPTDKKKGMYDSCVNDTSNPSIFVVFDNNQVYPEYLITYSTSSANQTSSYSSSSQYFSNPHNPSSQLTRSASSASRTSYSSSNQHFSHPLNPSTSQPTRSVSSANRTSYSSSNQHFSHPQNPSTSPSTRSASSANHTSYSSSTSTRQSPTLSSSRSSRDSKCICM